MKLLKTILFLHKNKRIFFHPIFLAICSVYICIKSSIRHAIYGLSFLLSLSMGDCESGRAGLLIQVVLPDELIYFDMEFQIKIVS